MWFAAVLGIVFFGYLLYTRQIKWLLGVIRNMTVGTVAMLVFNFLFINMGVAVGVNAVTVLIVGLLGAPGLLLLYAGRVLIG